MRYFLGESPEWHSLYDICQDNGIIVKRPEGIILVFGRVSSRFIENNTLLKSVIELYKKGYLDCVAMKCNKYTYTDKEENPILTSLNWIEGTTAEEYLQYWSEMKLRSGNRRLIFFSEDSVEDTSFKEYADKGYDLLLCTDDASITIINEDPCAHRHREKLIRANHNISTIIMAVDLQSNIFFDHQITTLPQNSEVLARVYNGIRR